MDLGIWPLHDKRVLDVGCGGGGDLLLFVRLGFAPSNLTGCELLEERAAVARRKLPAEVTVATGDALELSFEPGSFDIVLQSTVFTSLLDERFRERLAARMWSLVRPGGAVLWYDFAYDNPRNPDVRGVRLARVRELFPEGKVRAWRVLLAPPLARAVTRIHPALYGLLGAIPPLRTHLVCRITKPER